MRSWIPITVFSAMLAVAIGVFVAVYATTGAAAANVNKHALATCLSDVGTFVVSAAQIMSLDGVPGDIKTQAPGTFAVDFHDREVYLFYVAASTADAAIGAQWLTTHAHKGVVSTSGNLVEVSEKHPTVGTTTTVASCVKQSRAT